MKSAVTILLASAISATAAWLLVSHFQSERYRAELAGRENNWLAEKNRLEADLKAARNRPASDPPAPATPQIVEVPVKASPREILDRLVALKLKPGPGQTQGIRQIIQQFENLMDTGPAALPVIREFLARQQEFDYEEDTDEIRSGWRDGRMTLDFVLPPSLRLGLFNAVRRIGGETAEEILAETLGTTGRGVEVAYLARALEQLAPGKYKDTALAVARELLVTPLASAQSSSVDKYDKNWLYGLLTMYQDASFAAFAQGQLIRADGKIESSALKYLRDTLKEQALPVFQQAYQDGRLADPKQKEPLIQLALSYAGVDERANTMFYDVVTDSSLPVKLREDAIHELHHLGYEDRRNPTDRDLQIMEARLQVLEAMKPGLTDPKLMEELDKTQRRLLDSMVGANEKKAKGQYGQAAKPSKKPPK